MSTVAELTRRLIKINKLCDDIIAEIKEEERQKKHEEFMKMLEEKERGNINVKG